MIKPTQTRLLSVLSLGIAIASLFSSHRPAAAANFTGWDFENGTLQGWTTINPPTTGPTEYAALGRTITTGTALVKAWDPVGYMSHNPPAGYAVGSVNPAAADPFLDRSLFHDKPLVFRSPTFQITGGGEISAHLLGGSPGGDAVAPANYSAVTGEAINTAEPAGFDTSYFGIALRRDSDGAYLLHKSRTNQNSGGTSWQQVRFTDAELAPIITDNPGANFTLDLIDTGFGNFGNITMDIVTIPTPAGSSLLSGGGQWNILKRDVPAIAFDSLTGNGGLASADAVLALPTGNPGITAEFTGNAPVINIHGEPAGATALRGHFANDSTYLGGSVNQFAMKVTGKIKVLQAGDITFGFVANDGARLKIDGILVAQDDFTGDIAGDILGTINLTAGLHDVEFVMYETTGADTWELFVATTLGTFTSINQASFELLSAANTLHPGDFDSDGDVDGADFVAWQTNFPKANGATLAQGDADGDGDVDGADFVVWQTNFPFTPGPGTASVAGTVPVPEPHSVLLLAIGGAVALRWRRARR
jgi:hypothetical protein